MKLFFSLVLALVLLVPSSVRAQDVPEVTISWDIEFWAAGVNPNTGAPIIPAQNFLKSTSTCNQPTIPPPTGTIVNPNIIRLTDPDQPALPGRDCILGPNTSGILISLPLGSGMFGTATAKGATLASARSAASNPFNRAVIAVAPVVPTAVRMIRQ